jgi:hypothetical protein
MFFEKSKMINHLECLLKTAVFCSKTMYIHYDTTVEGAKKFMELLKDETFREILQEFNKTPQEIAREDCFYYKDEVWEIVGDFFKNR